MEFRNPFIDELDKVETVCNNVFLQDPNIDLKTCFPLVFSPGNKDWIFGAFDQGKCVASVCGYPFEMIVNGTTYQTLSIGLVGCEKEYRNQGIASKLLDLVDQKIIENNIDLLIISGDRGLYTNRGAFKVRQNYRKDYMANHIKSDYHFERVDIQHCKPLFDSYVLRQPRFNRTYQTYKQLLETQAKFPWNLDFRALLLRDSNQNILGYTILRFIEEDEDYVAEVMEQTIPVNLFNTIYPSLASNQRVAYIKNHVIRNNQATNDLIDSAHTFMIPDFIQFFNKVKANNMNLSQLELIKKDHNYYFNYNDELFLIDNLQSLLFNYDYQPTFNEQLNSIIKANFPIVLPTIGINYI